VSRRKRSTPRAGGRARSPARPQRGRVWILAAVVVASAAVGAYLHWRPPWSGTDRPVADNDHAMLDSLKAADARRDWVNALRWGERLGRLHPTDHGVLLARGVAWTNYANERTGRMLPRPPLRTSLERIDCQRRAIGLMDSSSRAAHDAPRWIASGQRLADLYDVFGLPGDALIAYETITQQQPDAMAPAIRAYMIRAVFYDPLNPDTSEYHRQMVLRGHR
jgi:hypothetical protein